MHIDLLSGMWSACCAELVSYAGRDGGAMREGMFFVMALGGGSCTS